MDSAKLRNIRIFLAGMALLSVFVLKPPTSDSLQSSQATLLVAKQLINGRVDVQYSLDDGSILKDNFKSGALFQGDTNISALMALQGTTEKLTILHKAGKVWQTQRQNGEFILKFEDIQKRRYIFLAILTTVLFLVGIFLPKLVRE